MMISNAMNTISSRVYATMLILLACAHLAAQTPTRPAAATGYRTSVGAMSRLDDAFVPSTLGLSTDMTVGTYLGGQRFASVDLEFAYGAPSFDASSLYSLLRLGAGLSLRVPLGDSLRLVFQGTGGLSAGFGISAPSLDLGWYYSGAAGIAWALSDAFSIGVQGRYVRVDNTDHYATVGLMFDVVPTAGPSTGASTRVSATPLTGGSHPVPPVQSRVPDARLSGPDIQALTSAVKRDPARNLPALVQALTADRSDDFQKVKAIHDWVALNVAYDVEAYLGTTPTIVEPYAVIARGASVCQGYSEVFRLMCTLAGFECAIVSGYGRGVGFDPLAAAPAFASNHAWNGVRIGTTWYLVDVTWDAGSTDVAARSFNSSYGTEYLFIDPQGFLYTHFPEDPRWQLVPKPVSYARFSELPGFTGDFAQWGLVPAGNLSRIQDVEDRFSFAVNAPREARIAAFAAEQHSSAAVPVLVRREGDTVRIEGVLPTPGVYSVSLSVFSEEILSGDRMFAYIGTLAFRAAKGSPLVYPYLPDGSPIEVTGPVPYDPRVAGEAATSLVAPAGARLHAYLKRKSENTFLNDWTLLQNDGTAWSLRTRFPDAGAYEVMVFAENPDDPSRSTAVATFAYAASRPSTNRFAALTYTFQKEGWRIVSPLDNPLPAGREQVFELAPPPGSRPADEEVVALTGSGTAVLARTESGTYRITLAPAGNDLVFALGKGTSYTQIVRYEIR